MALVNSREDHSMFVATEETAGMIGGKTVHEAPTEVGQVKLPDRKVSKEAESVVNSGCKGVGKGRKKVIPWTDEEHRKFLKGLKDLGKGAWVEISKEAVITKTAKQVTSHAQKYFLRQHNHNNKKRRSIHDVTLEDVQASSPSQEEGAKSSVTPGPSIQDTTTTVVVQVDDIGKGKGVLTEEVGASYFQYYDAQPHQTLPINYFSGCQGEGAQQTLPMNCFSGGQVRQPVFNLYENQGGGSFFDYNEGALSWYEYSYGNNYYVSDYY